jgi:colanic acid/amylovoran biosynthesis protein
MSVIVSKESTPLTDCKTVSGHLIENICHRIALLGIATESGNRGIGALACGTIGSLLYTYRNSRICIVDYVRKPITYVARCEEGTVLVEIVPLRFSKKPWQPNHIVLLLTLASVAHIWKNRSRWQKRINANYWLWSLNQHSVYLSIAGGDSFSDIYGLPRMLYVVFPQILALILHKPLVMLPQTYGPFKSRTARCIASFILRRAKLIYSRDKEGLRVVADLLRRPDERVRFAYDMGFALEPLPPSKGVQEFLKGVKQKSLLVGFNISGLLYMGGYRRNNMFGLKSDYSSLAIKIIDFLIEKNGCEVLLVPHVFGDDANSESDVPACKQIMALMGQKYKGRLHYLEGNFDQHEIKYVIGQCDFFLGSRMHACIAALSQCVPAVGLAYSRKFAGVLDSVGGGSRVVDLREHDEAQVLRAIGAAMEDKQLLQEELLARMPQIKESVLNLFAGAEFKGLLSGV